MRTAVVAFLCAPAIAQDPQLEFTPGKPEKLLSIQFLSDGKGIVAAGSSHCGRLWKFDMDGAAREFAHDDILLAIAVVSADGKFVATAGGFSATLWDAETGKAVRTFKDHPSYGFLHAAFSSDGKFLIAGGGGTGAFHAWEVATGKRLELGFADREYDMTSLALVGKTACWASNDKTVKAWDVPEGKESRVVAKFDEAPIQIAVTPDGKHVIVAGEDRRIRILETDGGKEVRSVDEKSSLLRVLAVTPDGKQIAWANEDRRLHLLDFATLKSRKVFGGHDDLLSGIAARPDGKFTVSTGHDGAVKFWSSDGGKLAATLVLFQEGQWIFFTPEGKYDWSSKAGDHCGWSVKEERGRRAVPLSEFEEKFRVKALASKILGAR